MNSLKIIGFIFAVLTAYPSFCQPQDNDTKLANHYYDKGEFEKAEPYYERAFKNYGAQFYFERYFKTLFFQNKFGQCEKLVEKQLKIDPYEIDNYFLLASVYTKTDRPEKANAVYRKLIDDVVAIQSRIDKLGKSFKDNGLVDYALETYLKGRKLLKKGYSFQLELAELYALKGNMSLMISEYLNLLDYSPAYLKSVQTYLSRAISFEDDDKLVSLLREEILVKVQKYPEVDAYNEMFIWYYLQKKEFAGAVIQAKALDKKTGGKGRRLLEIGDVCLTNKDYGSAIKSFDYVIEMGDKSPFYHYAIQQKLAVQFLKVTEQKSFTKEDLSGIESDYIAAISSLGKSNKTLAILIRLAKIQAFYLDNANKAEILMKEVLEIPTLTRAEIAEVKVLLGDILVVKGDIWEASLLYMQVEKEFSEDVIGHEAKLKNALVFYYDGEFDYAKAQLDVLKASTSKLIANDAMQLSLLLQDNLGIDTSLAPVQLYASADLLLQQNKYEAAIFMLDSLEKRFPFHSLVDEVLFKKAEVYGGLQNWTKAIEYYEIVLEDYGHDILGDDAAFRLAEIYYYKLGNKEKAAEYYRKILFEFSGSLYTAEARKMFRLLSGSGA